MLSIKKTKPLNQNNPIMPQNNKKIAAIYIDSSALFYTGKSNIEFYPGALDFIQKLIKKNIMIFIFSPDHQLQVIKNKLSHNGKKNPLLNPEILDGSNLNLKENAETAFQTHTIFILSTSLLKKPVGDRSKIMDNSEFGQILEAISKEFKSTLIEGKTISDKIIIIAALSEFTETRPLVFIDHPSLSHQAKDHGIAFIIAHPLPSEGQTITTPEPKNGSLSENEQQRSKEFFEAVNAYRLLKDYVKLGWYEKEESKTKTLDYFQENSALFLNFFEEGYIHERFSENSKILKSFTQSKAPNQYFLKKICNVLYKGIISRYADLPSVRSNAFEDFKNQSKKTDASIMLRDSSSNIIVENNNLNINAFKGYEPLYKIEAMPYLFRPLSLRKNNKINHEQKKQIAYFSSNSLFTCDGKTSIPEHAIDAIRQLINLEIAVVIVANSPSEIQKVMQASNILFEKLSNSPTIINYHYLSYDEIKSIFSKNFLFVLDLQSLISKEQAKQIKDLGMVVIEPDLKNTASKLKTLSTLSELRTLTQTEILIFVDSVFENNALEVTEKAYQLSIPFMISHPHKKTVTPKNTNHKKHPLSQQSLTITRENTDYKNCPVSAQFFDAIVAYAELKHYAQDPSKSDQHIAITLLSILREGHTSLSFNAAFEAIMTPELEQLYKRLHIGLISRYVNQNPAINNSEQLASYSPVNFQI